MKTAEKLKTILSPNQLFKGWRWHTFLLLLLVEGAVVGLGIWAGSPWYVLLAAIIHICGGFFNVKASKFYYVTATLYSLFYIVSAWTEALYGEVILTGLVMIPLSVVAAVRWLRAESAVATTYEIKHLHPLQYAIIFLSGALVCMLYAWLLVAIGAAQPYLSAVMSVVTVIAYLLTVRRSRAQWIAWLGGSMLFLTMWILNIVDAYQAADPNPFANLPLAMQSFLYLLINTWGLINWHKLYRRQHRAVEPPDEPTDTLDGRPTEGKGE